MKHQPSAIEDDEGVMIVEPRSFGETSTVEEYSEVRLSEPFNEGVKRTYVGEGDQMVANSSALGAFCGVRLFETDGGSISSIMRRRNCLASFE